MTSLVSPTAVDNSFTSTEAESSRADDVTVTTDTSTSAHTAVTSPINKAAYYSGPGEDYSAEVFSAARKVRTFGLFDICFHYLTPLQYVAAWYPYNATKLTKSTASADAVAGAGLQSLMKLFVVQPRKAQVVQTYTRLYFSSRVQPIFQAEWDAKVASYKARGEQPPKPTMGDRNRTSRRCWEKETDEVRKVVLETIEAEYDEAVAEYNKSFIAIPEQGKALDW